MKKFFLLPIFIFMLVLFLVPMKVQAANATSINEDQIEELLAGEGVTISNLKVEKNDNSQLGKFENASDIVGFANMNEGLILSTGNAKEVFSRNFLSSGFVSKTGAYEGRVYDPIIIEFDAVSDTEWISLQYIFASEEFDQAPVFNDDMYIYVDDVNIATINDESICINNLRNTKYHYDNYARPQMSFLGYTPLLSCGVEVTPGESVHFRIEVRDLGDPIFDSAMFLKAHSLKNIEPPPLEENPHPPTGERIPAMNFKKQVSGIQLYLSNGQLYMDTKVNTDSDGKIQFTGYNVEHIVGIDDTSPIYVILDDELKHGASLIIEYTLIIENTTLLQCNRFKIEDLPSKNLTYNSVSNADYEWDLKQTSEGDFYLEYVSETGIPPLGTAELKLTLTTALSVFGEENLFDNSAKATVEFVRDTLEQESKASTVLVIPPLGETVNTDYTLVILGVCIFTVCVILVIIAVIVIRKKKF